MSWIQLGQDIDGEAAGDYSSFSVSLSADGSRVAIGAPYNDGYKGYLRVYELSGDNWVQLGEDIAGEAEFDFSGYSVSLSADGSRVAIGAPNNDVYKGHVRVYELNGNNWVQVGDDIEGEAEFDSSGYSVSLSADGSRVAIGAVANYGSGSGSGHVRVYQLSGNTWTKVGQDIDGEAAHDESGYSVSLSADGSRVAIGAPYNDGYKGHVRVYQLSGNNWVQLGQDIDGEAAYDESGRSVSLSEDGSRVAIGAIKNDGSARNAGHVRVYELSGDNWVQIGEDIEGEAAEDRSGYSISLSADGSRVAIGAPNNDDTKGHVRIYEFVPPPSPPSFLFIYNNTSLEYFLNSKIPTGIIKSNIEVEVNPLKSNSLKNINTDGVYIIKKKV